MVLVLVLYVIAKVSALSWRKRIVEMAGPSLGFTIPLGLLVVLTAWNIFTGGSDASGLLLAGSAVLCLAVVNSVLNTAMTREAPERIRLRKKFASARRYFREELKRSNPGLQDDWFPYLVAFGLGNNVDQWFKEYRTATARGGQAETTESVCSSSGATRSSWTGGGGLSGGAGAGRSWAAAVGAMSAGVPSASSGSSGSSSSGSSSSSSSSGGGGGGGW
jgi:uncharacterized membrane protein YgcG